MPGEMVVEGHVPGKTQPQLDCLLTRLELLLLLGNEIDPSPLLPEFPSVSIFPPVGFGTIAKSSASLSFKDGVVPNLGSISGNPVGRRVVLGGIVGIIEPIPVGVIIDAGPRTKGEYR